MALKGITKIQLFDAKTGELTDEIVKENMVTNAVPNILNPTIQMLLGTQVSGSSVDIRTDLPGFIENLSKIGKKLFGGILVFSEPLEENVNNIVPSVRDRNNIVGYAGQYSAQAGNLFMGSYNQSESTELENGFTHVWDFSSEQCNGTISALALTSQMGGDGGWNCPKTNATKGNMFIPITSGNFWDESKLSTSNIFGYSASTALLFNNIRHGDSTYEYDNAVVCNGDFAMLGGLSNVNSGVFTIRLIVNRMATKVTLKSPISNAKFFDDTAIHSKEDYQITTEGFKKFSVIPYDNIYRVVLTPEDNPSASKVVNYKIIDFILNADGTVTRENYDVSFNTADVKTVLTAKGYEVGDYLRFNMCPPNAYVDNDNIYIQSQRYNGDGFYGVIVRVSRSNSSDIEVLDGMRTCGMVDYEYRRFSRCLGEIFIHELDRNSDDTWRTSDFVNFYRVDNGLNEKCLSEVKTSCLKYPYVGLQKANKESFGSETTYTRVFLLAPYLATINNLESPVVKTTAKSMKITYTIQNV